MDVVAACGIGVLSSEVGLDGPRLLPICRNWNRRGLVVSVAMMVLAIHVEMGGEEGEGISEITFLRGSTWMTFHIYVLRRNLSYN